MVENKEKQLAKQSITSDLAQQKQQQESLQIGQQIRDLRKAKGITLSAMAKHIDRSLGYLSQVERGVSALPISTLKAISDMLNVNISWFFHADNERPQEERNYIVRHDNRRHLNFTGTGISEELLTPHLSKQLQMILTTLEPKADSLEPRQRAGAEAGLVQSGRLELTIGDKRYKLNAGDSFSLHDNTPHRVYNPSDTENTVIVWTLLGATY